MVNNNHILFKKLQNLKHRNRWIIFCSDISMSTLGTAIAGLIILTITNQEWHAGISVYLLISAVISAIFLQGFKVYRVIHTQYKFKDLWKIIGVSFFVSTSLATISVFYAPESWTIPIIIYGGVFDFVITVSLLTSTRIIFVVMYYFIASKKCIESKCCLLYGGTKGVSTTFIQQINSNSSSSYYVRGVLTHNREEKGSKISGRPIFYIDDDDNKTLHLLDRLHIKTIIFPSKSCFERERDGLVSLCIQNNIQISLLHNFKQGSKNIILDSNLKPIGINDLLDRDDIDFNIREIEKEVQGRVVLVTGAAGDIGSELVNQLVAFNIKQLLLIDNSETSLYGLQLELEQKYPHIKIVCKLCDIQKESHMDVILNTYKPELIFHTAAYKHVPMLENNPCEAVLNNIGATINIANCAIKYGVKKFILISTDKAISPTNIMGATKRIAELFIQNINTQSSTQSSTQFIAIRFGKLLGSNNSVVTRFQQQITAGGPVIISHPEISRFFMSIPKACNLILEASTLGHGGEIFAFDMGKQINIVSLARNMIYLSGLQPDKDIEIIYRGLRPGEKLHEEELALEENTNSTEHPQIRISHPIQYDKTEVQKNIEILMTIAKEMDTEGTVLQMKKIVPEFISKNSIYEMYDETM